MRKRTTAVDSVNYYISRHFMLSDIICPCCDTVKVVPGLFSHMRALDALVDTLGIGLTISSGHRCSKHNRQLGGAPRSWHLLFATDVLPEPFDKAALKLIADRAEEFGFTGIGIYETHIHLDQRPEPSRWRG